MNSDIDSGNWYYLVIILVTGWLVYLLAPVLTPFIVAALLAYLGDPAVDRLEGWKLSRTLSVVVVFSVMTILAMILFLVLFPLVQDQLNNLFTRLPEIIGWLQNRLFPVLAEFAGYDADAVNLDAVKDAVMANWRDVGNLVGYVIGKVSASGQTLLLWISYIILIPVVTFYLLRDWDILVASIRDLIPRQYVATVSRLTRECDRVLAEFLRGQLLVMFSLGFIYSIGLWLAGIEFALLIGMLSGLVSFVPYLGSIVGVVVAGLVAFMQHQDLLHLVFVGLVFGAGQALEGMVLSPLLLGDRIGLHPVAVIFAVMAGGQLFGFVGILLALPVAAVITVLLRYLHEQYLDSNLYSQ